MIEKCDKFEVTLEGHPVDDQFLPLRKTDDLPPICVRPKDGAGIKTLSVSTAEPFKINQTPQSAAAATSGAVLTIRGAALRPSCILNISYSTNPTKGDENCIFELPTRVPIHTPGPHAQWKTSDVRLERYVTVASDGTKHTISELATWMKNVKEATIWLEGSSGSGKSTFVERFCETVESEGKTTDGTHGERQAHWCVVVLTGKLLWQPPESATIEVLRNKVITEFLDAIEKRSSLETATEGALFDLVDDNYEEVLQAVVERYQEDRLLLVFEEFDGYFQKTGENAREILKFLKNEVVKRFAIDAKGGVLVVVDQVAPSIRGFKGSNALKKPTQHWKLNDCFTIQDVKDILGQLTPHTGYDDAANRIWVWTRGQPTLVNSLIFQYVDRLKSSSVSQDYDNQASVCLVDSLAYSETTQRHVDYLVKEKYRSDGNSFERLSKEERDIIERLPEDGPVKITGTDEYLKLLIKKGILEEVRSFDSEVSYRIPNPLIRLHRGKRHQEAG